MLLSVAALLVPACSGGAESTVTEPVILVGMDGLEWEVMRPLLAQGKLPNFQALIDRGVGASLRTELPTFSPVLWTSMVTGVPPQRHGVLNFSEPDPLTGRLGPKSLPYTSNARKVPALWNIASDHGKEVLSVGWWVSYPAEHINGRVVASYAAQAQGSILWKPGVWQEGLPELTWPPLLMRDLEAHLAAGAPDGPLAAHYDDDFALVKNWEKNPAWAYPAQRDNLFRLSYLADLTHLAIFKEQFGKQAADLNMVYFGLADVAGHFWWRYRQPGLYSYTIPADQIEILQAHIDKAYLVMDRALGEILEAAPADARILVVSDHGMHGGNFRAEQHPQSGHHEDGPPGVLIAAGPGIPQRGLLPEATVSMPQFNGSQVNFRVPAPAGSVYDVAPTLLAWLGLPLAEDMPGTLMADLTTEAWRSDHPLERVPSHADGFRAATPSVEPSADANKIFQQSMLGVLGYVEAAMEEAERQRKLESGED